VTRQLDALSKSFVPVRQTLNSFIDGHIRPSGAGCTLPSAYHYQNGPLSPPWVHGGGGGPAQAVTRGARDADAEHHKADDKSLRFLSILGSQEALSIL
jgi:hypothetical protein